MEGGGLAAAKRTAAARDAWICFADEAGQGMRPPKGRTWAPRGHTPEVRVVAGGRGRVTMAGVVCFKPGHRPRFLYKLHVYRGRKGEAKSFTWQDYRDFIAMTHTQPGGPVVWCRDNLSTRLTDGLAEYAVEHREWLEVFQFPSYAPELNPQEGVWSLVKRGLANFAAADLNHLVQVVKRKLKQIQYRPHLIEGCLTETGLIIEPR